MAVPTFFGAGTALNSTGASVSPAWPANHAVDDLGVLVVETGGESATMSAPSGWTAITGSGTADVATLAGSKLHVFLKRATSTAEAIVPTGALTNHVLAQIYVFRGVSTSIALSSILTAVTAKATASTTTTFPSVTTSDADNLIIFVASRPSDAATTTLFTPPTGGTALSGHAEHGEAGTTSGHGGGFMVGSATKAAAGATSSPTTTTTSMTSVAFTLAFPPFVFSDPTSIGGIGGWWDSSHAASFTYSSGSVVSQWNDRASTARHMVQATTADQPSRTGTRNGLATVVFDGTDDKLTHDAGSDTIDISPWTWFAVFKDTGGDSTERIMSARQSAAGVNDYDAGGSGIFAFRSGAGFLGAYVNGAVVPSVAYTTNTWQLVRGTNNGTTAQLAVNGTTGSTVAVTGPANVRYLRIGATQNQGTGMPTVVNATEHWTGELAELVLYNAALTTDQIAAVESYLTAKWVTDSGTSASATPAAVALTATVPAPTVTAGSSTTPTAVALTAVTPAPSSSVNGTATPAVVALALSTPATATTGASSITPPAVTRSATIPAPTTSGNAATSPGAVPLTTSISAPTVRGSAGTSPAAVARTVTVPSSTTTGNATATPTAVSATATTPAPTVSGAGAGTASPSAVQITVASPAPTGAAGASTAPAVVAASTAVPAPITGGAASITPTAVPLVVSTPAPTVAGAAGGTATPASIALTTSTPQSAGAGGSSVAPAAVALVAIPVDSTVEAGSVTFPPGITLTAVIPEAVASSPADLVAGQVTVVWATTSTTVAWRMPVVGLVWALPSTTCRWELAGTDVDWQLPEAELEFA